MKTILLAVAVFFSMTVAAYAQDDVMANVKSACAADQAKFCSQVTPGNADRMLACAYAHEDKLSGQCSHALYQAAAVLQAAVASFEYLAESCADDVQKYCADVKMGEGRIANCLYENTDKLSETCKTAFNETIEMVDE